MATPPRKLDHIRIVIDSPVEHEGSTLLEKVVLRHVAVPESSLDSVSLATRFLGKPLRAPLMVTGMTGGHEVAARINCAIAEAVAEHGLAMGVGSQRAALEHPELASTFRSARDCGGDIVLVANIGAPQLVKGYGVEEAIRAVNMIDADALAVHLNASQEAFQPEGDTDFEGVLQAIEKLVNELPVPVIVKETGHGIGYKAAAALRAAGVRFFDVSGSGGTSWVLVEKYRAEAAGDHVLASAAWSFRNWGVPTAQAIVETRWAAPDSCIVASGGIRTGLDVAKAVALGADMAGIALPAIKAYAEKGAKGVSELLSTIIREIRAAVFLSGARSLKDLRVVQVLVLEPLRGMLEQAGVDLQLYLEGARSLFYPGEHCQ